jgi:RNA polymerase sigma-70 factor (sigma-E family)
MSGRARDQSFERFVRGGSTGLLRTAVLLVGDREVAEDLLQATLMRVARRWVDASRSPEAYAHRVLVNLSRDRHRRVGRRVAEVPWNELTADPLLADHADAVAARSAVIAALAQLPTRQREVLVLRFYADLSVAETAAATGASEGTVKSYTSRALLRMRNLLGEPSTLEVSHERR